MTTELDPLIHVPTRLRIVATLAALPDGDALSFTRLQDMLGLTPGNLIIQLRKLEDAGYLSSTKTRNGSAQKTLVALTGKGRTALSAYIQALRDLLGGLDVEETSPAAPSTRLVRGCEAKAAGRDHQAGTALTLDADPADPAQDWQHRIMPKGFVSERDLNTRVCDLPSAVPDDHDRSGHRVDRCRSRAGVVAVAAIVPASWSAGMTGSWMRLVMPWRTLAGA